MGNRAGGGGVLVAQSTEAKNKFPHAAGAQFGYFSLFTIGVGWGAQGGGSSPSCSPPPLTFVKQTNAGSLSKKKKKEEA